MAQTKHKYEAVDISKEDNYLYAIINQNGDTLKKLDPEKYIVTLQPKFDMFLIISMKGRDGWSAIDINENYLFQVYNRLPNEPFSEQLREDRIRIVGETGLIGFADSSGGVVIEPKFKKVTNFDNGFAIFESDCKKVHNDQEGEHSGFILSCEKVGYIDKYGNVQSLETISFDKMKDKINWNGEEW